MEDYTGIPFNFQLNSIFIIILCNNNERLSTCHDLETNNIEFLVQIITYYSKLWEGIKVKLAFVFS